MFQCKFYHVPMHTHLYFKNVLTPPQVLGFFGLPTNGERGGGLVGLRPIASDWLDLQSMS